MTDNSIPVLVLARVHYVDEKSDLAWLELATGPMVLVNADDLPVARRGEVVQFDTSHNEVIEAPPGTSWPRQWKAIGTLLSVTSERSILRLPSGPVIIETDGIIEPLEGRAYFFDDAIQHWTPLSEPESRLIDEYRDAESYRSDFHIQGLKPDDGGRAAFGGMEQTFDELLDVIETNFESRDTKGLSSTGKRVSSGAIFYGPPGTGKTHLARSLAEELGAQLITVNGPELIERWFGSTEKSLRELFERAKEHPRSIIFIDEFDSLGPRRGPDTHEAVNRQVGQLLSLTDSASGGARPFVIAATNMLEDIDPAFLRPGRFDFPVEFVLPSQAERLHVLAAQSSQLSEITGSGCLKWLAASTNGWTPAELAMIWKEGERSQRSAARQRMSLEDVLVGFESAKKQHQTVVRAMEALIAKGTK